MRVLQICQRDDPDTGGSLRVAEALVHEQRSAGLEVWLLFLYGPPASIAARFSPWVCCLELESSQQVLTGFSALRRAIKRIRPDIIHCHDGILWPRLVLMQFRIPVFMHSHLPAEKPGSLKQKLGWALIKGTTDGLFGISLHTIETWVRAGYPPSRIHYVPNGVDPERFRRVSREARLLLREQHGLPEEKKILLWAGRLHRSMKGSDRAERVAGLLPPDMVLVVVGNGPEYDGMLRRCRSLIEAGRMIMVGSTSTPEDYYQAADAFLFTSYHEPFGLVILEAAACGLPIVAFPVTGGGGGTDLLKEFGAAVLDDADDDSMIRQIIGDAVVRSGAEGDGLEQAVTGYSWRFVSERIVDVYKLALGRHL
jgi:glycosyltransferase involved in cell wall biosynthesis